MAPPVKYNICVWVHMWDKHTHSPHLSDLIWIACVCAHIFWVLLWLLVRFDRVLGRLCSSLRALQCGGACLSVRAPQLPKHARALTHDASASVCYCRLLQSYAPVCVGDSERVEYIYILKMALVGRGKGLEYMLEYIFAFHRKCHCGPCRDSRFRITHCG